MCKPAHKRAGRALLPPQLCALHPLRRRGYALAHCGAVPRLLWWLQALLLASELRVKLAPAGLPASQCVPDALWLLLVDRGFMNDVSLSAEAMQAGSTLQAH